MNDTRRDAAFTHGLATDLLDSPLALFVANGDGRVLWASRRAEALLGWSEGELVGRSVEDLVPPPSRSLNPERREPFLEAREGRSTPSGSVALVLSKDGRELPPVEIRLVPLPSVAPGAFGAVMLDHGARHRLEQELLEARRAAEAADRAKSAFLAHMSHDMRTPLHAILGFARHLLDRRDLPDSAREEVELVASSGTRLLALVNDVLELARIDAGSLAVAAAPAAAGGMLRDLAATYDQRAQQRGLKFTASVAPDIPDWILLDEGKARLALENLLDNAIKFTEVGGVELRAKWCAGQGTGELVVDVEDTGPGIDLAELPRLLAPFEQGERGRHARQGTGLGLALANRLAGLLGGRLEVASERGRGSRLRLTLPSRPIAGFGPSSSARIRRIDTPQGAQAPRILVAERDAEIRTILVSFLRGRGFQVDEARDGPQALESVSRLRPAALVLDVDLPKLNGVEVAERLRLFGGNDPMPIFAVTARSDPSIRKRLAAAAVDTVRLRPISEDAILEFLVTKLNLQLERSVDAPTTQSVDSSPLSRLALLPPSIRQELRSAAETADITRLERAVAAGSAIEPQLEQPLTAFLSEFDYAGIIRALDAPASAT